jgi:integrase
MRPNPTGGRFSLSLLLGTRRRELLSERWSDVHLESEDLADPLEQGRRPHLLPLPTAAVEILKTLPRSSECVFTDTGASGHLTEAAKVCQRIRKRADVPEARIYVPAPDVRELARRPWPRSSPNRSSAESHQREYHPGLCTA